MSYNKNTCTKPVLAHIYIRKQKLNKIVSELHTMS